MFEKAHITFSLVETQHANHAFEIVHDELVPGQFDAVVTVSGDGLLHEVVNGLLTRKDFHLFRSNLTIGCVPGGTGNGLVKSLLDRGHENYGISEAAFRVLKGRSI